MPLFIGLDRLTSRAPIALSTSKHHTGDSSKQQAW
ncbi:hypothetical protein ISS312_00993 [Alteromonas mediterranea]|nr:hypothetical protein ISS312_00993 [Alteromonas mediterranea]